MKKIRILIVDDHQIVRMGLAALIQRESDMQLVGEAADGREAVRLAHEQAPDVILMDLMMPVMNGAESAAEILAANPAINILVLTTFGESREVEQALNAGAVGALIKNTPHEKLVAAIRDCINGRRTISPEIARLLNSRLKTLTLTERQLEILGYAAKGLTTKEIGQIIGLGRDGVNAHLRILFNKLGANSKTEAVTIAINEGLLRL